MSHDQKCYELAKAFASDSDTPLTEAEISDLAENIQDAIEDWFEERRSLKKFAEEIAALPTWPPESGRS